MQEVRVTLIVHQTPVFHSMYVYMDQYHHKNQYVSTVITKTSNYLLPLQKPVHYNCKQNAATTKPLQQQFKRNGRPIVAIEIAA